MLTTTTVVPSLGTDLVSVRPASSERPGSADISFAQSFDESTAASVGTAPPMTDKKLEAAEDFIDEKDPQTGLGAMAAAAANTATKQNVDLRNEIPIGPAGAKSQTKLPNEKLLPASSAAEITPLTINSARSGQRPHKASSPSIPMETSDGPVGSANLTNPIPKSAPSAADGTKTILPNGAAELQTVGSDVPVANLLEKQVPITIQGQKKQGPFDKDQAGAPTERAAKIHACAAKVERSIRAEDVSPLQAVQTATVVGSSLVIPIVVSAADGTQDVQQTVAGEEALSLNDLSAYGGAAGKPVAKAGIHDKNGDAIKKEDNGAAKISDAVSTDDPASRRLGGDDSKAALSSIKATDGVVAAARNTADPSTVDGLAHLKFKGTEALAVTGSGTSPHVGVAAGTAITNLNARGVTEAGSGVSDGGSSSDAMHRTLTATPTSLEVGVVNGTHGWLKIRADLADGGGINASLSTATRSGQEMLHGELPSLTAYLQSERVAVNTVTIQPPPLTAAADLRGLDGGMTGGGQQLAQQSNHQEGGDRHGAVGATPDASETEGFYNGMNGVETDALLPSALRAGAGSWLNVRA